MKRLLIMLLALCTASLGSCALAECSYCGGDNLCDTCGGRGYVEMQEFGSDKLVKVACLGAHCDVGHCTECEPVIDCDVCGSDGLCDTCGGRGYTEMQEFGSNKLVKIACAGASCDVGRCTACAFAADHRSSPSEFDPNAFADPVVEEAVRAALGKKTGVLTAQDLESVRELSIKEKQLVSIDDFYRLPNIEKLLIINCALRDITPLSSLTKLRILNIYKNQVSDLTPLSGLAELRELNLSNNPVHDFSALSGLPKLQRLILGGKTKEMYSDLDISSLTYLSVRDNSKLKDLNVFSALKNLKELCVLDCAVTDISSLSALTGLEKLTIQNCDVQRIAALSGLNNLSYLYLGGNRVTDISPLGGLTNLRQLYLLDNQIENISPLARLQKLERLELSINLIKDFSVVFKLPNLVYFTAYSNPGYYNGMVKDVINHGKEKTAPEAGGVQDDQFKTATPKPAPKKTPAPAKSNERCDICGGDGNCNMCGGTGYDYTYELVNGERKLVRGRCRGYLCSYGNCRACGGDGIR